MEIIKAQYGFADTQIDVTDILQSSSPIGQKVGKKLLKSDPVYGKRKTLTIDYITDGQATTVKFQDGDTIRLKTVPTTPQPKRVNAERATLPTHLGEVLRAKCITENGYEGFLSEKAVYEVIPNPNRTPRPEYFLVCDNGELRSIIKGRFELI